MAGTDRRSSPRATLRGEAIVYVGSERVSCRTVDVGKGGMALASPVGRAPGQFLRVNFHLNGGSRMLDADAVLVRDSPRDDEHIWGLMFQKLDPMMTHWITEYVEKGAEPASPRPRARSPQTTAPSPPARAPVSPQRSRPTPAATTFPRRKRPTPARTVQAPPPEPEKAPTAAAERVDPEPEREPSVAAMNVEPPPPERLSARRARYEEPPPPERLTSAAHSAPRRKKTAKERHHERMEAVRSQRELVDLYREAVKTLRAEHDKKKR